MLRRALIALSFVVALTVAGVSAPKKAEAGHDCYDDFGYGSYGYSEYYPGYLSSYGYAPRHTYYRPYSGYGYYYGSHHYGHSRHHHRGHYGHHGGHHGHRGHHGHHGGHHGGHGGVHFSIGF